MLRRPFFWTLRRPFLRMLGRAIRGGGGSGSRIRDRHWSGETLSLPIRTLLRASKHACHCACGQRFQLVSSWSQCRRTNLTQVNWIHLWPLSHHTTLLPVPLLTLFLLPLPPAAMAVHVAALVLLPQHLVSGWLLAIYSQRSFLIGDVPVFSSLHYNLNHH